jgi:hypothetical protein
MEFFLCFFEFAYFFVDSLIHVFLFSHGYSALFLGGGLFSLLVGSPTANPSSRRKEKASRTEKSMLACWWCLQPQIALTS